MKMAFPMKNMKLQIWIQALVLGIEIETNKHFDLFWMIFLSIECLKEVAFFFISGL
jgi:hypothetical protein